MSRKKKIHKEAQEQGLDNDAPVFVTSGYAKKLQELKEVEEAEKKQQETNQQTGMQHFKMNLLQQSSRMKEIVPQQQAKSSDAKQEVKSSEVKSSDAKSSNAKQEAIPEKKQQVEEKQQEKTQAKRKREEEDDDEKPVKVAKQTSQDSIQAAKERAMARLRNK